MLSISENDIKRFWKSVAKTGDINQCWLWVGGKYDKKNYGRIKICGKAFLAHRISFIINKSYEFENRGVKNYVCHTCDNPSCVNPNHLFIGSPKDNVKDMFSKNRQPNNLKVKKGSEHWHAKLNEKDIPIIRERLAEKEMHKSIAESYNVSSRTIGLIHSGKIWAHIKEGPALTQPKKNLTLAQAIEIKKRLAQKESPKDIASSLNISANHVRSIRRGVSRATAPWPNVNEN